MRTVAGGQLAQLLPRRGFVRREALDQRDPLQICCRRSPASSDYPAHAVQPVFLVEAGKARSAQLGIEVTELLLLHVLAAGAHVQNPGALAERIDRPFSLLLGGFCSADLPR